jgi:hypothetical protein
MRYRFYITHNAQPPVEVFPLNFKEGTINYQKENGQLFFRRKFNGSLVFTNRTEVPGSPITDYTYFKNIEDGLDRCLEISIDIHRSCGNEAFESWWMGYFTVTSGKWNIDRCSVEFTDILPDDEYRCMIENGEVEQNILDASPIVTTSTTIVTDYEFYTCRDTSGACSGSLPPGGGWLLFHTEEIDGAWTSIYYRERLLVSCLAGLPQDPGGTWVLLSNDCATTGFATYVRTPVIVYANNPNPDVAPGDCIDDGSGGFMPDFPPRTKNLPVTRTNTPTTPVIIGYDEAIASISGYDEEYTFTVRNNPGSSYVWSGTFVSVISGQGTNTVTVKFTNTGTVTLQVIETTICSTAAAVTKNITVQDAGSLTPTVISQDPAGPIRVCKNQETVFYSMPVLPENFTVDVLWSVTAGATIVGGQGTDTVEIDFGDGSSGDVTVSFSADNTTTLVGSNINGSIDVSISNAAVTPDINGLVSVCPNASGIQYDIPTRPGATYVWTVQNGTIASGQGTGTITVDWDNTVGADSLVSVKETINCGCNFIMITDCSGTGEPSFFWCPPDGTEIVYDQNRLLIDVLGLYSEACGLTEVQSDFFEMNPPGDTPHYSPGINYVTAEPNRLMHLMMAQKSDIINPGASQPATRGMLSFNDLMLMLREIFQVYWLIENGNLRLEHVSWFSRTANPNYDLTTADKFKYIIGKGIYFYEKEKMPKYERYKWSEAQTTDFVGAEISYDSACVNQDSKSNILNHAPGNITTDIEYIFNEPDAIEKTGFVLLVNDLVGSTYTISSEIGLLSGLTKPNMHLSWANLHYNYHRYERVLLEGMMNNEVTAFITAKRTKKQDKIRFPYCCDEYLNPVTDLITTQVGEGEVEEMTYSLRDNTLEATLLHDI